MLFSGDMFLFVDDMFVALDDDIFFDALCLPLLLVTPLAAVEREPGHELGSRAFLRWQSTQYKRNLEIASLGMKAYKSATYMHRKKNEDLISIF